jgi:hypothetical protein
LRDSWAACSAGGRRRGQRHRRLCSRRQALLLLLLLGLPLLLAVLLLQLNRCNDATWDPTTQLQAVRRGEADALARVSNDRLFIMTTAA